MMKRAQWYLAWTGAMLAGLSWGTVALAGGNPSSEERGLPPSEAFRIAIYGIGSTSGNPTGGICPSVNGFIRTNPSLASLALVDLRDRCNGASSMQPELLGQIATEEVGTQATSSIETSTQTIGARLAAVRAGVGSPNLQRFSLNADPQPTAPAPTPTLVASLLPFAAVSSAVPAKSAGPAPRLGLFVNGHAAFGEKDSTRQEAGFDFTSAGVTAGLDYRVMNNLVLGLALNYQATDHDLDSTRTVNRSSITSVPGGSVDTQNFNVSLYGTFHVQKFYIDSILTWGWGDYDIRRIIQYDNTTARNRNGQIIERFPVNQVATANTDSHQFAYSFGMGYDFTLSSLTVGPYIRLNYSTINIDRYQESICNTDPGFGWAMAFRGQKVDSLITVGGLQGSYAISTSFGVVLPQIRIEWNHEIKNERRDILASFVADPASTIIALRTDGPDTDFIILGAGVAVTLPHGWSAFGDYETVQALSNFSRHAFTVGVRKDL